MEILSTILMVFGAALIGLLVIWLISLLIAFVVIALAAPSGAEFDKLNDIDFN